MSELPYASIREAVRDEIAGLLLNMNYLNRRIARLRQTLDQFAPEDWVEEIAFLESMERDIIMGLCRLDEEGRDVYSLRAYRQEVLAGEGDQARTRAINRAIEEYRRAVNPIKVKCRNRYIGHLSRSHDGSFTSPEELLILARQAVELMDLLCGESQVYVLSCDQLPDINLRERLGL